MRTKATARSRRVGRRGFEVAVVIWRRTHPNKRGEDSPHHEWHAASHGRRAVAWGKWGGRVRHARRRVGLATTTTSGAAASLRRSAGAICWRRRGAWAVLSRRRQRRAFDGGGSLFSFCSSSARVLPCVPSRRAPRAPAQAAATTHTVFALRHRGAPIGRICRALARLPARPAHLFVSPNGSGWNGADGRRAAASSSIGTASAAATRRTPAAP